MADYDCLLIGHNELDFEQYYNILQNMASSIGRDHVAFTDMQLNHVMHGGKPYQATDILTRFYNEGLDPAAHRIFYNGDCLWTAISYLGTYLSRLGYSFDYVNLFHLEKDLLKRKLKENNYTVIALTGTMYVFEQNIWEVVQFIRKHSPKSRIVAGGPYISKQAEDREPEYLKPLFRYLGADFYCYAREGEQTLVKLIDALKSGADIGTVHNLAYKQGRDFVVTPRLREVNPLADNMVDYSLFADAYAKSGWANIRVSDGCPYACGFCAFPEHGNQKYEIMAIDRIEREFDAIKASGAISHIFFVDATLNVPRGQFKEMLRMMIRNRYGFKWHCFFRCDQTDEETIDLMREAGCEGVFLGLESANETVLRNMDKGAHKKDFRRTMPWFKRAGIRQMVSVQVGFPGETYDTFRETMDFVEEIQPDYTRIQIWFCDVTTPVWRKREQFKLTGKGYGWSHYTMDAETAVDLVVKSFMSLRNAAWVPDPGYNWVSFYIMQKNGMSIERQKQFLSLFSAAAKERLLKRGLKEISPTLLDSFRKSAQFDRTDEVDMSVVAPYDGSRYAAAEAFWIREFADGVPPTSVIRRVPLSAEEYTDVAVLRSVGSHTFDADTVRRLRAACDGAALPDIVLAAYGAVLPAFLDRDDAAVVASLPDDGGGDDDMPYPVQAAPPPGICFRDAARRIEQKRRDSEPHRLFGFFTLTNALRMKEYGSSCPSFRVAYLVAAGPDDTAPLDERLKHVPAVRQDIGLALRFTEDAARGEATIDLSYSPEAYRQESVEVLGEMLVRLLLAGSAEPGLVVRQPRVRVPGERHDAPVIAAVGATAAPAARAG
jgi:radical SAM PhpK family P-methyltransferase